MRRLCLVSVWLLGLTTAARMAQAQAAFTVRNDAPRAVTNCLTGARVVAGNTFRAGLYAGQTGVPESALALIATTDFVQPGLFNFGTVTVPGVAPGSVVTLQVRCWETAFGATYEQALAAGCSTALGRPALTGRSPLVAATASTPPTVVLIGPIVVCFGPCVPTIRCPTNIVVECTNAAGNLVTFNPTASSVCCSSNVSLSCFPPSGSRFARGVTTVVCTAIDGPFLTTNTCTFTVTVRDTTPPGISCPPSVSMVCTNAAGNVVTFGAIASADNCDSNVTVTCAPPSGSRFPPGTNVVRCVARDDAGNTNVCSFNVSIICTVPVITQQPVSITVTQGGTATFRVTATGTPPPRFQWRFNGQPIAGATDNVFTIVNAGPNQAGDYDVVVSNIAGNVISSIARLILAGLLGPDLYIKDTPADTGVEPNPDAGAMWLSQDIWVQTDANPLWSPFPFAGEPAAALTAHSNPEYRDPKSSRPNYVYVRVRNRGLLSSSGTERLRVYWAKASTGLGWSSQWVGSDGTGYLPNPATFGCTKQVLYGDEITKPRKNAALASATERNRYRDAIVKIGTDPAFVFNDGEDYFDKQDDVHGSPPSIAHHSPGFTPWHREFLNRYEVLLREADPRVSLLYWDWTTDPENSSGFNFFTASFLGASGRGSGSPVAIGAPFDVLAPPSVTRRLSSSTTPPAADDASVLAETDYADFRSTMELSAHDVSHGYIGGGGNMSYVSSAAEDPVFFMLHANADRLWAQWQREAGDTARLAPSTSYDPLSADAAMTGNLAPWDGTSSIDPWTVAGGYSITKTPKHASIVFPPIYDTAPLTIPVLAPGESVIFQIPWYPPNPADFDCFGTDQDHVCLLARIETSTTAPYGMTFAETGDLNGNVRNNNNIAWRNVEVVDNFPGLFLWAGVIARNIFREIVPTRFAFTIPPESANDPFLRYGRIYVDLGREIFDKWTAGGRVGGAVEPVGGTVIQIFGSDAFIGNIALLPEEARVLRVRFELNPNYPPPGSLAYHFDVTQYGTPNNPDAVVGGQRYSIDLRKLVLVADRSVWKYLDDGTDQGTAWRQPDFDDSKWLSGQAELGYGDNPVTIVNGGPPTNRIPTTYFRKAFNVADPSIYRSLLLRLKRDDGAVVYLNGAEIHRVNLPNTAVGFNTLATATVAGAQEEAFFPTDVSNALALLVRGRNVLAVEVHQASPNSSDVSFDLELCANVTRSIAPPALQIAGLNPALTYQFGQLISLNVDAFDPDGRVALVEFFVDGKSQARSTSPPFNFVLSNAPPGAHLLMVSVTDDSGETTSDAANVSVVSNLPPAVAITAPAPFAEFQANDLIVATASASDPLGAVAQVRFYLRAGHEFIAPEVLVGTDATPPYAASLGSLAPGMYFVTAVARDNLGAEAQSIPVEFIVAAPARLTIRREGNAVVICWPETVHGYQLQGAASLSRPIPWLPVNAAVEHIGEMHCVRLPLGAAPRFFRLIRPSAP